MKKIFLVVFLLSTACSTSTPAPPAILTATILPPTATPRPSPTLTWTPTKVPTSADYGAPVVLVSAGEFIMGSENGELDEKPVHTVYLDAYYIDKYEVTNALYKTCEDAGVCDPPRQADSDNRSSYYNNPEFNNYPVIYMDWLQAKTYCEWRGGGLPTEAQWEKAARGPDGRTYPWGEGIDCNKANYNKVISSSGEVGCPVEMPFVGSYVSYKSGDPLILGVTVGATTAVGSYQNGSSPYGVYDMAGNVWEWVADWYSESYYQSSPTANPLGPDMGESHVLKSGSFSDSEFNVRAAARLSGSLMSHPNSLVGFRCARDVTP